VYPVLEKGTRARAVQYYSYITTFNSSPFSFFLRLVICPRGSICIFIHVKRFVGFRVFVRNPICCCDFLWIHCFTRFSQQSGFCPLFSSSLFPAVIARYRSTLCRRYWPHPMQLDYYKKNIQWWVTFDLLPVEFIFDNWCQVPWIKTHTGTCDECMCTHTQAHPRIQPNCSLSPCRSIYLVQPL
jgi:hypothetical protein